MARKRKRQKKLRTAKRAQQKATRPVERLKDATDAFNQGDYSRAMSLATRALEVTREADHAESAKKLLAETYFRIAATTSDHSHRLAHLQKALKYTPQDVRLHYHSGVTMLHLGQAEKAQKAFDMVAKTEPNRTGLAYLYQLARVAAKQSWDQKALSPAEVNTLQLIQELLTGKEVSKLTPLVEGPLLGDQPQMWQALLKMADKTTSSPLNELQQSTDGIGHGTLHYYEGVAAMRKKEVETAQVAWQKAVAEGYASDWFQKNQAFLARERATELAKEKQWGEIARLGKQFPTLVEDKVFKETVGLANFHAGYEAAQAGEWDKAARSWRKARETISNRHLAQNLALAEESLENWNEAAEAWREMVRRRPRKKDHPDYLSNAQVAAVWQHCAECYLRLEWIEDVTTCLKNAIKYAPDDPEMRLRLVDIYLVEEREEAAENELNRVLKIDPDFIPALLRQGYLYTQQWNRDPMPIWRRILELDPEHRDAKEALAHSYVEQVSGQNPILMFRRGFFLSVEEKIELLEEGLKELPEHPKLLLTLADIYLQEEIEDEAQTYVIRAWDAAPKDPTIIGVCLQMLVYTGGGEILRERLPLVREIPGIPTGFWIAQGNLALEHDVDEEWVTLFWNEALKMAEEGRGSESKAYVLVQLFEMAHDEEAEELAAHYEAKIREEVPRSGAVEFVEAYRLGPMRGPNNRTIRLMRKTQRVARKAGEMDIVKKAEQLEAMMSGRMNPFFNLMEQVSDLEEAGYPVDDVMDDIFDNLDEEELNELRRIFS